MLGKLDNGEDEVEVPLTAGAMDGPPRIVPKLKVWKFPLTVPFGVPLTMKGRDVRANQG